MINNQRQKAFTLLEMLVVIGIIAVLVALATTSYSTAQKKARDVKRKSDLKSIQNCLEQYYGYNNNFKYDGSLPLGSGLVSTGALPTTLNCGSGTITTPVDPMNNSTYQYTAQVASTSNYEIRATLEQGVAPDNIFSVVSQQ